MRKAALFIIALCVVSGACKKRTGPVGGNSVQKNNNLDSLVAMHAAINGVDWHTDSAFGYTIKSSANDSSITNLFITAVRHNSSPVTTLSFFINDYQGPGRYVINPPDVSATYYYGNTRHFANYGDVTITGSGSNALTGTFYFFTADSITVNGDFNVAKP